MSIKPDLWPRATRKYLYVVKIIGNFCPANKNDFHEITITSSSPILLINPSYEC